jgi:hypothetical protein
VQSVDWSPTTECTLPDQETSERRPMLRKERQEETKLQEKDKIRAEHVMCPVNIILSEFWV